MISVSSDNSIGKVERFLRDIAEGDIFSDLDRYGQMGVDALAAATPVDTGMSARSWQYRVTDDPPGIEWYNTNTINGVGTPIVILIQYGHGTGTGGYIPPYDFINPAMKPIFKRIETEVWKKVR